MKKITLWLFTLLTCWQISAQTTVTVGSGTSESGAFDNGNPIYRSSATSGFAFSQSVQLLTAADLAAVGVTSGAVISKIAYYKTSAFTLSVGRTASLSISLKNSAATALVAGVPLATWTAGSTNCYTNAALTDANIPAAAGWVEFVFATPFNYSGGSIEVALDWQGTTPGSGLTDGAFLWQYTASSAIQAVGTSSGAAITGNLAATQLRQYNTQLTYTNNACVGTPAPGNVIAPSSICGGASATLSLQNATSGSGVTYQWFKNAVLIVGETAAVYTIPSVTTSDSYSCAVTCAGNTTTTPVTTVGPVINIAPSAIEPFTTFLPNCWQNAVGGDLASGPATFGNSTRWVDDGFGNVGATGAAKINIYQAIVNDWLISPLYIIPATGFELKFDAAAAQFAAATAPTTPWEADDVIEVLVSTGTSNWTVLYTYNDTNQPSFTGSPNSINLSAYAGQSVRFAFRGLEGATNGPADIDFYIDNFEVRLIPSCAEPIGLTSSAVTATTATVSWNAVTPTPVNGYQYVVSTSNVAPTVAGTGTSAITVNITSGLLAQTTYYLFVRSMCAGASTSIWSGPSSFTTLCGAVTAPATETFDTFLPICWSKGQDGDLTTGPIAFLNDFSGWSADGFANVTNIGAIDVNPYDFSTLNDWIISPQFVIPATGYKLQFDAAATQYDVTNGAPTTPWEADDIVEILVSTTGTTNWTVLNTFDSTNQPTVTGTNYNYNLDAYSGQTIRIAFRVFQGAAVNGSDIEFSIDNLNVSNVLKTESFDLVGFSAYPNPVKDVLNLSYTKDISNVSVLNLLGQEVISKSVNASQTKVDMSNLSNGTYLVKVTVDGLVKTMKVLKQ